MQAFDADGRDVLLCPPRKLPRATAAEMVASYREMREHGGGHPVFMTLTSAFMRGDNTWDQARKDTIYPELVKGADGAGLRYLPGLRVWLSRPDAGGGRRRRRTQGPRRPRPTYQWIEANKGSQWIAAEKQPDVTPQFTRGSVDGGRPGGHRHRVLHPQVGGPGRHPQLPRIRPTAEMRAELRRLNAQLTRLAPALLADRAKTNVRISVSDGLPGHLKATQLNGALYVFAQNLDLGKDTDKLQQFDPIHRAGAATITVPGRRPVRGVEVMDEHRTLTAQQGRFVDDFGPLAEHVYRIPWRGK